MNDVWSSVEMKAQEWGPIIGAKAQEIGTLAGSKAQEWGTTAGDSIKGFGKKMKCKKCVVKDFFKRDWTMSEKILMTICLVLAGVVIGFLIAPIKKGISCGNNNGNTYNEDGDWWLEDEEEIE